MSGKVIAGYDGSLVAGAAVEAAAMLLPDARAQIAFLSTPPFATHRLLRRLRAAADGVNELIEITEREGTHEAHRLAGMGVALARAAGWNAEALVKRSFGGEGRCLAELAEQHDADLVVVGRRGVNGVEAILGSVSRALLDCTSRPVLVIPHPLLQDEFEALADGPVIVGVDGSREADAAWQAVERLMPRRDLLPVSVGGQCQAQPHDTQVHRRREVIIIGVGQRGRSERAVAQTLNSYANSRKAALIVVGTRDRPPAQRLLRGSVAGDVVHYAHRPVMVVPHRQGPRNH